MIKLIYACQLLVILALEMVNPFMPLLIMQLGDNNGTQIAMYSAVCIAAPMLGMIIMAPIWGRIGDSFGYKPMLLRATSALTLSLCLTPWASTVEQLLLLRFLQGCFAGFIGAMQTYAIQTYSTKRRTTILAKLQSYKAIGTSLGGLVGGSVITLVGFSHSFYVAALLTLLASLFIVIFLPHTKAYRPAAKKESSFNSVNISVVTLGIMIFLSQLAKFIPQGNFAIYVQQYLHSSPIIIGLLYSIPALSIYCGSTLCSKLFKQQVDKMMTTKSIQPIINYFIAISTAGMLLALAHCYFSNVITIVIIRFGLGLIFASLLPALISLFSSGQRHLGLAIGMSNSIAKTGNLSGLIAGGYLAGIMPLNYLYLFVALSYAAIALIALLPNGQSQRAGAHQ